MAAIRKDPDPARLLPMLTDRIGRLGLRSAQILLVLILTIGVVLALIQLKVVVIPVLIAIILAAAFSPLVALLRRRGASHALAATLTLLGTLLVLGVLIALLAWAIERQWSALVQSASEGFGSVQSFLQDANLPVNSKQLNDARQALTDYLTSAQFGSSALAGVSAVTQVLTSAFLLVVVLFYFLKDGDRIWNFLLTPFSAVRQARGHRIGRTGVRVLGDYVRGTAIVALADAVGIGAALFILQVPLALPLTVIVFLTAFIPIVGATIAGVLAALVALVANGPVVALIIIGVVVLVNQLEGNLLQPLVMGQSLKLHPLVILLALTAGTILGGVIGAVLAVPIAAVSWAIVKVWDDPGAEPEPDRISAGADPGAA
jgi:putative heme transporter